MNFELLPLFSTKIPDLEKFLRAFKLLCLNKSIVGHFCKNKSLVLLLWSLKLFNWAFLNGLANLLGLEKLEW